jgi:uncharacterized membrane protein YccC
MTDTNALEHFFDNGNWQSGDDGDWQYEGEIDPQQAAAELTSLLQQVTELQAKLDEAITWHEGDDSPHARLEQELAQLRSELEYHLQEHDRVYAEIEKATKKANKEFHEAIALLDAKE